MCVHTTHTHLQYIHIHTRIYRQYILSLCVLFISYVFSACFFQNLQNSWDLIYICCVLSIFLKFLEKFIELCFQNTVIHLGHLDDLMKKNILPSAIPLWIIHCNALFSGINNSFPFHTLNMLEQMWHFRVIYTHIMKQLCNRWNILFIGFLLQKVE